MADQWQSLKLGNLEEYQGILRTLESLADLNATNAEALKNLFEIGKAASFASIDPLFTALNFIADAILDILNDLKEIGFYEIDVTPFSGISSNRGRPVTLGSMFSGGVVEVPGYIDAVSKETYPVGKGPNPNAPQGLDAAGNNILVEVPYFEPNTDEGSVANISTGLLELTPSQLLGIMADAFYDENDPNRPQFSSSAQVSGIILLAGSTDFKVFAETLASIANFFELSRLSDLVGTIEKIINKNPKQNISLRDVGQLELNNTSPPPISSGTFQAGQVIIGKTSGFVATVDKVSITETQTVMRKQKYNVLTAALSNPESITNENGEQSVNVNSAGLQKQTLLVQPISKIGAFIPGEIVCLAEPCDIEVYDVEGNLIKDPSGLVAAGASDYQQIKAGSVVVGKVLDAYDDLEQSVKPDFTAIRLKELIPVYGDMLTIAEDYVKGVKGTIKKPIEGLQSVIDYLEVKVEQATRISDQINKVIDLFTVGIPSTGLYAIYLPPEAGGIEHYIQRFTSAENAPPNSLKYSAGIMILNGGADITAITTLGTLLGL